MSCAPRLFMDIAGGFSGGLADIFAVRRNFAGDTVQNFV